MTLHKVIEGLKLLFKFGILFSLGVLLLFFIVRVGTSLKEHFFPTPPPPPTVSFGKLPTIIFPQDTINNDLQFTIDTLTGTLPSFPDRATIYKIATPKQNLLALKRAQEKAMQLGFLNDPTQVTDTVYKWNTKDASKTLLMDILRQDFTYTLTSPIKENSYIRSNIRSKERAITEAQAFMSILADFPSDIDTNKTATKALTYKDGALEPATSLANTKIFRVDFFQENINDLPVFYPTPSHSTMYAIVAGDENKPIITESSFVYFTLEESSATYPIKTIDTAYEELKKGAAYIAAYSGTSNTIAIKNAYLGYYAGAAPQAFLMPIFVFEGKDNFTVYISAIDKNWIE